jgi:tetratricopeptide (TPR) repeat protein
MDPHLFEMMHGVSKKANSETHQIPPSPLEDAIQSEIKRLMALEKDAPNQLITPQEKLAKIEQKVRASTDFEEFGKLMSSAFQILRTQDLHLDQESKELLKQRLDSISQNLKSLNSKELTGEKMKAALAIPEETQALILEVAIAKFSEGLPEECLALFYFLANTTDGKPDYWYRTGLVAEQQGNYQLALQAFAATSKLAPDFIGGHLFASECNILYGRPGAATFELEEAKKCLKSLETHEAKDWRKQILEMEQKLASAA